MSTKQYSVTVIPDSREEQFIASACDCRACKMMHVAQEEWDTFTPRTHLQRGMKDVIARIEARAISAQAAN
jgi:hypothetical protein